MGRVGITYEQVAAAADALLAETGNVTLKALRERLGTGGMGTIHRHLNTWQANRPKVAAPAIELPPEIHRAMGAWVLQASTEARAAAEEGLVQAQAAANELAKAGEKLEEERDQLLDQVARLTTERDQEQATANARQAEITRLTKEVERERDLAGKAQVDAAQAKHKLEDLAASIANLKESEAQLRTALKEETAARVKAEREAAVLLSERDAARKEAQAEKDRIQGLQSHLDAAHAEVKQLRIDHEQQLAAERAAAAKERAAADKAKEDARAAAVESAELKGQLKAAEQTIARLEGKKTTDKDATAKS